MICTICLINLGEDLSNSLNNGTSKTVKSKATSDPVEQTTGDADDEQDRDKALPIVHDVTSVVWVKMAGHPW
jgi:hypothetical protein